MAAAGIGSRRHCEELILAGRVEVDRQVVTELGTKVDMSHHEVRVDGTPLGRSRKAYYLVYKPEGTVSTNHDPAGRPRVIDLLPESKERLFTVGRLDLSSEGLILLTNDGELANRLAHPRYGVEKTYQVLVAGMPERDVLEKLRHGVHLAEGFAKVESVRIKSALKKSTVLEIVLREGRNREIRRLLARVGHKVLRLKRVAIGGVKLKEMVPGEFRRLTDDEIKLLRSASRPRPRSPRPPRPRDSDSQFKPQPAKVVVKPEAKPEVKPARPQARTGKPSRPGKAPHEKGPQEKRRGRGGKPFRRGGAR